MHPYESPTNPDEFIDIVQVDLADLLAGVGQLQSPEIYKEIIKTFSNPEGEEIENVHHPVNQERRQNYYDDAWEIVARNYLVNGVKLRLDPSRDERVRKVRDVYGNSAEFQSDHMLYLTHVFTTPREPNQLAEIVRSAQGITLFDREAAGQFSSRVSLCRRAHAAFSICRHCPRRFKRKRGVWDFCLTYSNAQNITAKTYLTFGSNPNGVKNPHMRSTS